MASLDDRNTQRATYIAENPVEYQANLQLRRDNDAMVAAENREWERAWKLSLDDRIECQYDPLWKACCTGWVEEVRQLIALGAPVNLTYANGRREYPKTDGYNEIPDRFGELPNTTPLWIACKKVCRVIDMSKSFVILSQQELM